MLRTDPDRYDFDENAMYWFQDNNFDYLTPLPDGKSWPITHNMDLKKENGQWVVIFDDWTDWSDLFLESNRVSKDFIEGVLAGDAYQFFERETVMSVSEVIDYFKSNIKDIEDYDYLEDLFIFKGGEEDRDNIKSVITSIYKDSEFSELKDAINNALMDADQSARESEAFKQIKKEIVDHFELGTEEYQEKSNTYKVNTTITGADKLAKAATMGRDYHIDYFPSRDNYWAEMDPKYFNERLKSNLELHVS